MLDVMGNRPSLDFVSSCPGVRHLNEGAHRHKPNSIFVGEVKAVVDICPWSLPLPLEDITVNENFMKARGDLPELLWPLRNKCLVCDCANEISCCWAYILRSTFLDTFSYDHNILDFNFDSDEAEENSDFEDVDTNVLGGFGRNQDLAAGGRQGSRKRPGQLIEDGLLPQEHIERALETPHPFVSTLGSTETVRLALRGPMPAAEKLISWRRQVCEKLKELADVANPDDSMIFEMLNPSVKAVLKAYDVKKISFMRELNIITMPEDFAAISCLVIGLPMLGWTFPAFGLMERVKTPSNSYADWKSDCARRNSALIGNLKGSGDEVLDFKAFSKTLDELKAGVLVGPFQNLDNSPFENPGIVPRCGIWECHGEAEVPDVRNIDNMLLGEQNATAGSTHSHRPTDVDALSAQSRAVASSCPNEELAGWCSDFSKAYKQVPADPSQVCDVVLAQWDPTALCVMFFVALSLVFGSRTAPVNFARFPAWFCFVVAILFRLPATHCVDDVIFIESVRVALSGKVCWDLLMVLSGWRMSTTKETWPEQLLAVIGVSLDLRPFPMGDPTIMVTTRRIQSLQALIKSILMKMGLGSGEASSLAGKLGFTLSAAFGRVGRCRIRPILKRAYSSTKPLTKALETCLLWWLVFLESYSPRPIPTALESLPLVISYSDGEGGLAGIGAALWHPHRDRPVAVYAEVPEMLRAQWQAFQGSEDFQDIFLVEALGPLLLLWAFPKLLRNCLWIHFIDNCAAEASLIRGSSSSDLGDHVVGLTWSLIQKRLLWAYFDRVSSKANPVDGLSRRCFDGPWEWVTEMPFPIDKLAEFAATMPGSVG